MTSIFLAQLQQTAQNLDRARKRLIEFDQLLANQHALTEAAVQRDASQSAAGAARGQLRDRELEHKRGQARLANRKRLDEWAGEAGTVPLTFRWSQVQRMLSDLRGGLQAAGTDENALA